MSVVTELEGKLKSLKATADGDLHALVLKLEAIYQHIVSSHVEDVVKAAVVNDVHEAATKAESLADTLRSNVDDATAAVDKAAKK